MRTLQILAGLVLAVVSSALLAQPAVFTDLGTLTDSSATYATADQTSSNAHAAGEVRWYRFVTPGSASSPQFLDIDTTGTGITDSEIGLYTNTGNLVAADDDDGPALYSALSFGATTPTRGPIGTGVAGNGRDGALAAGTYWLAIAQFDTTFGATGWLVSSTGIGTGSLTINIRHNLIAPGDPEIDVQRNSVPIGSGSTVQLGPVAGLSMFVTTWAVRNEGATNNLSVSAVSASPSGVANCTVAVGSTPTVPFNVTPAGSQNITVEVTPTAAGPFEFTLTITNNDVDEGTYTIVVQGYAAPTLTVAENSFVYTVADGSVSGTLAASQVIWFSMTVPQAITGAGTAYLDLDSEGSVVGDTEIGVYDSTGALIANDDDDGSGALSALSFGATATTRGPAVGGGTAGDGRDGNLNAATYFIAVGAFNTVFNASGFSVTSTSASTGSVTLNVRYLDPSIIPPDIDVQRPAATSLGSGLTATDSLGNVLTTGQGFTYTIANVAVGAVNLTLGGSPLVDAPLGTQSNCSVSVNVTGTSASIAAGGSTTFSVTVTPASAANFSFTLEIASNDPDEASYVVTVSGVGQNPNGGPVVGVGTSAWVDQGSGLFTLTLNPGDTISDSLGVTDPESDLMTVTVTNPGTALTTLTTQPTNIGTATAGPLSLDWIGTVDGSNPPGNYDWTIDINDGTNTTSITARIIVNNVAPVGTNGAITPTLGDGTSGTPYTRSFIQTQSVAVTDLFDVTDDNTGQSLTIFSQTRTGGATATTFPFNGQFNITGGAGSFVVSVSAATLIGTDVGTHEYELVIEDVTGGNQITVYVTLTVTAQTAPTFTPGTSVSIAQGTSQTGVVVGTAADGQDPFSALNVAATNVPTGVTVSAISVNATNGEVTATITVGTGSTAGTALIEFTVTDSLSATGSDDYSFTIVANTLPVITAGSAVTMGTSASLTNRIIADVSDAEDAAGTLTVSVVTAPAGVAISAIVNTAGEVRATITTTAATVGANVVVLQVADSNGATATANFTVNVSTGGGGGGGGGSDGDGGGCAASGGSSSLWLALFGLMAVAAMALRVRRNRA